MARVSLWIGLDVGADETTVCGTDDVGAVVFEQVVATKAEPLHALLRPDKRNIKLIGLESGSFGIALCRALRSRGYPVAVFEARQASKFLGIRRNKTDRNDARGLADLARLGRGNVSEVRVKSTECQRLRSTLVTRQRLVQLRLALEGTMRSLFRLNGGKLKSCYSAAALRKTVSDELKRLRKTQKVDLREDVEPLLALSEATRRYLEALDDKLANRAKNDPVCSRFLEIPGIGPISALTFFSAIDDPHRFRRNSDVGPYLGMVPIVRESGQSVRRVRISKMGDTLTRTYLTTAAQHHLRHNDSAIALWGGSLRARLGKSAVHVAIARKLAVTMLAMWKTGERYHPYYGSSAVVSETSAGEAETHSQAERQVGKPQPPMGTP